MPSLCRALASSRSCGSACRCISTRRVSARSRDQRLWLRIERAVDVDSRQNTAPRLYDELRQMRARSACRSSNGTANLYYAFPLPRFGKFEILWERLLLFLGKEGLGTFS